MKIQLKRSGILDGDSAKAPSSEQMDYGELAVNYNVDDPAIFLKDSDNNIVRLAGQSAVGGDLQAVTDAGNTTTNGATFGGNVDIKTDDNNITSLSLGYGYAKYNGNTVWYGYGDGGIRISNEGDAANAKIKLNPNGSAAFTGLVNIGDDGADPQGHTLYTNGAMYSRRDGDNKQIYRGYKTGVTNPTLELFNDGSATFAGRATVGTNRTDAIALYAEGTSTAKNLPVIKSQSFGDGGAVFAGFDKDGYDKVNIMSDGSAIFAGTVNANTSGVTDDVGAPGAYLSKDGAVFATRPTADSDLKVWAGFTQGTSAPTSQILANGNARFAGNVKLDEYLWINRSSGVALLVQANGDGTTGDNKAVIFADGSAQFASTVESNRTSASASEALFRGQSDVGSTPGVLQPKVTVKADGHIILGNESTQHGVIAWDKTGQEYLDIKAVGSSTAYGNMRFYTSQNSVPALKLDVGKNATFGADVTAVNFNSTSDATLKHNINPIDNALELINEIVGVRYNWNSDDRASAGVLAQDVETVLPELVANGEHKSVNYNGLVGVLVEAVKELSAEIQSLKQKVS